MRWMVLALLVATALGEELDGTITSGKAKRLVDEAYPLYKEADAIYKAWVLEQIEKAQIVPELKRAIALFDEATRKLSEALDVKYDPSVNHLIRLSARKLAKLRFRTEFLPPPKAAKPDAPAPPPAPPKPPQEEEAPPPVEVVFAREAPPALPAFARLPETAAGEDALKRDRKAIEERVRDYCDARRAKNLLYRHRLCRGKGCEECFGTGKRINLFHFRKAFWTSFTPGLRDATGALASLKAFHARAERDPAALGPLVKSFRIGEIEHHGYWATARLEQSTTEGKLEQTVTLISIGSSWFFYQPEADRELLPE